MFNYIDIIKHNYLRTRTVTNITAREDLKNDSSCTFTDYQIHINSRQNL